MPKRLSKDSRPKDINQLAHHLVQLSTSEPLPQEITTPVQVATPADISRIMAEMGRRGGRIGGKRRLETMTKTERRKVAIKGAKARWKNSKSVDSQ
jgi:hypothetical protein